MSAPVAPTDLASLSARSRRLSVSAIPRPTSGTSRHATPTSTRRGGTSVYAETNGFKAGHLSRKSWHPNDGAPPTSFHMSSSSSATPESSLPYKDRPTRDLSGIRQQLHIQTLSSQSLNSLEDVFAPSQNLLGAQLKAIPKSKTMSNLLSSSRDMTPQRHLLQPLGPPLPRTQTLGNISCFGPPSSTPSPRKPTSVTMAPLRQPDDASKLNVADALSESRMTEKEMKMMVQVQKEAAANRARLKSSFATSPRGVQTGLPRSGTLDTSSSLENESVDINQTFLYEAANPSRLQRCQKDSPSRRFLFVRSNMSNAAPDSGPSTISTVNSVSGSDQSEGLDLHTKLVESAESPRYWAGRYVSLCDRLRTQEICKANRPSRSDATSRKFEHWFETSEKIRMSTALNELRQSCQTTEATKSFEEFESELTKTPGVSTQFLSPAGSFAHDSSDIDKRAKPVGGAGLKPMMGCNLPQSPGNASTTTSRISSVNAEAVMIHGSEKLYGMGGLAKNKTTGNLAAHVPTMSKRQPAPAPSSATKPSTKVTTSHRRRRSLFDCSPEALTKVMRDREYRAARRAAEAYKRSTPRSPYFGLPENDSRSKLLSSSTTAVEPRSNRCESTISRVNAFDPVVGSLDCVMLESGHGLPPPPVSRTDTPRVQMVKMAGGGKEKLVKSRRKSDRQVSGEMVKNILGAGMREVKKMGRRVGGWGGSSEDSVLIHKK